MSQFKLIIFNSIEIGKGGGRDIQSDGIVDNWLVNYSVIFYHIKFNYLYINVDNKAPEFSRNIIWETSGKMTSEK